MPTVIEAALIGDSHTRAIETAADERDITFRRPITAASPMFLNARFETRDDGQIAFIPDAHHFDTTAHPEKKVQNKTAKTRKLSASFNGLFETPLPVFINIGTTAHTFVTRIIAAQDAANLKNAFVSRNLATKAAHEYFSNYKAFYTVITQHCPDVTCFYGPTRFTARTQDLWLSYDEAIASDLTELGVKILDLRADLGDATLALRPEYHVDNAEDQVHANAKWGHAILDAIQSQLAV
jgi:hypothetical protein